MTCRNGPLSRDGSGVYNSLSAPVKLPEREESEPLWLPERSARPLAEGSAACLLPPPASGGPSACGPLRRANELPGAMPSATDALQGGMRAQTVSGAC
jgi:hypothetical protein